MGITTVFSRSRSIQRHDQTHFGKINGVEKKRWSSSVRSYLCGEQNSAFAAEDSAASVRSSTAAEVDLASFRSNRATNVSSTGAGGGDTTSAYEELDTASVRSSEATVNQPLSGDHSKEADQNPKEKQNSAHKLFQQEDAAVIIQSAFRSFRERRGRDGGAKTQDETQEPKASPSRESVGTSIEVQTGNSSDIFSIKEESLDVQHTIRHRTRAQVLKFQEDWDDSTVSSVISKMRIQNRLEAATRRERALAYAFSQQLRICSKKKQSTSNSDESNTGWSWLERWMAARQPEITLMEDNTSCSQKTTVVRKRMLDAAMEEKESCGSNEVSSLVEVNINLSVPKNVPIRPAKTRNKVARNFSRQNSASSHLCPRESKVN